jgi:hypothetical protein
MHAAVAIPSQQRGAASARWMGQCARSRLMPANVSREGRSFFGGGICQAKRDRCRSDKADSPIGGIENPSPPRDRQTSKPEEVATSLRSENNLLSLFVQ